MSGRSKNGRKKAQAEANDKDDEDIEMGEVEVPGHGENAADADKRRQIRHDYRKLITETQKKRFDLIRPDDRGLFAVLTQADELFNEVKRTTTATREAALDSHLLVIAATLGNQQAHQLHTDLVAFEPTEFAEKIITFTKGRQIGLEGDDQQVRKIPKGAWAKLGREALPSFRRVPAFHFMLGSFERGEIQKSKRSANRRRLSDKELGPKIRPQNLDRFQKDEQKVVTTEEVERILEYLKEVTSVDGSVAEPISFFEFIVNPGSFSQTVENMFYLAFLVNNGHAEVYLDEDRLPIVSPSDPYVDGQTNQRVERKQVVITLDIEQWREIIKVFDIEQPIIPDRSLPDVVQNNIPNGHIDADNGESNEDE